MSVPTSRSRVGKILLLRLPLHIHVHVHVNLNVNKVPPSQYASYFANTKESDMYSEVPKESSLPRGRKFHGKYSM